MKLKNYVINGSDTVVLPINSAIEVLSLNTSDVSAELLIELLDEDDEILGVFAKKTLEAKESHTVKIFVTTGQKIKITAVEEINSFISALQELTVAKGTYSNAIKTYRGDGQESTYALPENAPANNHLEIEILIDDFYRVPFGEYSISEDGASVIFAKAPYLGADIKIKLFKQE